MPQTTWGQGFKVTARIDPFVAESVPLSANSAFAKVSLVSLLSSFKGPITWNFRCAFHRVGIVVLCKSLWFSPEHYLVAPRVDK